VWHLAHHHGHPVSRATVSWYLVKHGLVVPEPKKRPKSSYTRFAAQMPNECWQASASAEPTPEPTPSSWSTTIRVIDAATGALLRELLLDPAKRYQPIDRPRLTR
jgi:hypothetical protein